MDYKRQIDYSSLSCYSDCPRKFLFQYIMNFRSTSPNIDLTFGSMWHFGLEQGYKAWQKNPEITPSELTQISIAAANLFWKVDGEPNFPDPDAIFPKSPGHAASMYQEYWHLYYDIDATYDIIGVETPFTLQIHPDKEHPIYVGLIDLVLKKEDRLKIIDHKTGKAVYPITLAGYEASFQTDGYLTIGKLYFDKLPTMTYNLALAQKSKIAFERFDIFKRDQSTERFLQELSSQHDSILIDLTVYENEKDNTNKLYIPKAFERSPGYACTQYFRKCAYFDLCMQRNNPYLWAEDPPQGFKIEEWNPDDRDQKIRKAIQQIQ